MSKQPAEYMKVSTGTVEKLIVEKALVAMYFSHHARRINREAYSAAGEMGFGWWLVEHYFSYHVDCLDGCGLGEPARGG